MNSTVYILMCTDVAMQQTYLANEHYYVNHEVALAAAHEMNESGEFDFDVIVKELTLA